MRGIKIIDTCPMFKRAGIHHIGYDTIGWAATWDEAKRIAREHDEETEGDNDIQYIRPDENGEYKIENARPLYF